MTFIQLIILAIVQGLTEFIPVSSSAHLILAPLMVDSWGDQGRAIDVAAHVGSLGAVMLYFRKDTANLIYGGVDAALLRKTENAQLFWLLAVATAPLVVFGGILAVSGLADTLRDPRVIGASSIIFGVLLWIADRRPITQTTPPNGWRAVLWIGAAQALAAIPGTSRSGATMTAARWLGFDREQSARFSMLLAIPAIAASGLYETLKMISDGGEAPIGAAILVAIFSFVAALLAIDVFLKLTKRISFTPFVVYRIGLGLLLFALFSS
ncbi:MAG: undecaprenyl-diphosphate phosphatase [Pseudomonadota bacterium]